MDPTLCPMGGRDLPLVLFVANPWQSWPIGQQGVWGPNSVHPAPSGQIVSTQVSGGQILSGQGTSSAGLKMPSVSSVTSVPVVPIAEHGKAKRLKSSHPD